MMHGSFGTVGILSKLTFKLVPAKPYVKVRYERYSDVDAYVEGIRRHMSAEDMDFMDGILFSPGELMLSLGTFVDRAPYTHKLLLGKALFRDDPRANGGLPQDARLLLAIRHRRHQPHTALAGGLPRGDGRALGGACRFTRANEQHRRNLGRAGQSSVNGSPGGGLRFRSISRGRSRSADRLPHGPLDTAAAPAVLWALTPGAVAPLS